MTMQEFYDKYNLNKYNFASIAGVGTRSLIKYDKGETIRGNTKLKIEKAIRIAEKYELVRPQYDYGKAIRCGMFYKNEFHRKNREYEETFKQLIKNES